MTSFKTTYPELFCTALDVRLLSNRLNDTISPLPSEENRDLVASDPTIQKHIFDATGIVRGFLYSTYGGSINATPYASPVLPSASNAEPRDTWGLDGINVATTAITEMWTILFSSETAFTVRGSISGDQGSGTTAPTGGGASFTSTNTDVVIPDGAWRIAKGGPTPDAVLYFSTYKHHQAVVAITAKLACAGVLRAILSGVSTDDIQDAKTMEKQAMDLLKMLIDPKSGFALSTTGGISLLSLPYRYDVSHLGEDVTKYAEETDLGKPTRVDDWNKDYN